MFEKVLCVCAGYGIHILLITLLWVILKAEGVSIFFFLNLNPVLVFLQNMFLYSVSLCSYGKCHAFLLFTGINWFVYHQELKILQFVYYLQFVCCFQEFHEISGRRVNQWSVGLNVVIRDISTWKLFKNKTKKNHTHKNLNNNNNKKAEGYRNTH